MPWGVGKTMRGIWTSRMGSGVEEEEAAVTLSAQDLLSVVVTFSLSAAAAALGLLAGALVSS